MNGQLYFTDMDGTRVPYRVFGKYPDQDSVVAYLVQGIGMSGRLYENLAGRLADFGYSVIMPLQPGCVGAPILTTLTTAALASWNWRWFDYTFGSRSFSTLAEIESVAVRSRTFGGSSDYVTTHGAGLNADADAGAGVNAGAGAGAGAGAAVIAGAGAPRRVLLIGHSLGACTAIEMSVQRPEQVARVITLNAVGGNVWRTKRRMPTVRAEWNLGSPDDRTKRRTISTNGRVKRRTGSPNETTVLMTARPRRSWLAAFVREPFTRGGTTASVAMATDFFTNLMRQPRVMWDLAETARQVDATETARRLAALDIPVDTLWSKHDWFVSKPAREAFHRSLGDAVATVHEISGAHGTGVMHANEVVTALRPQLQDTLADLRQLPSSS